MDIGDIVYNTKTQFLGKVIDINYKAVVVKWITGEPRSFRHYKKAEFLSILHNGTNVIPIRGMTAESSIRYIKSFREDAKKEGD